MLIHKDYCISCIMSHSINDYAKKLAYIISLRPDLVSTTNPLNHIQIVWTRSTLCPFHLQEMKEENFILSNLCSRSIPGMFVVVFEWKERNCTEEMNRGLYAFSFSSISSWVLPFPYVDHETLSLSHYCVKSFLLGFFFL